MASSSISWVKVLLLLMAVLIILTILVGEKRWSLLFRAPRQSLSSFSSQLQRIEQQLQRIEQRDETLRRAEVPKLKQETQQEQKQQKEETLGLQEQQKEETLGLQEQQKEETLGVQEQQKEETLELQKQERNEPSHIEDQEEQTQQQKAEQQEVSPSSPSPPFPIAECHRPTNLRPVLAVGDIEIYDKAFADMRGSVKTRPVRYHEWGSGGSTAKAAFQGAGGREGKVGEITITSVESYLPWCRRLSENVSVQCLLANNILTYLCIQPVPKEMLKWYGFLKRVEDVGSYDTYIRGIGTDTEGMKKERGIFMNLKSPKIPKQDPETIKSLPPSQVVASQRLGRNVGIAASTLYLDRLPLPVPSKQPDIVFIDGRYRVACALMTLLYVQPQSVVLIHDFWGRPAYTRSTILSDFYDVLNDECKGRKKCSMVLLKPRPDVVAEIQAAHAKAWEGGIRRNNRGTKRLTDSGEDGEGSSIVSLWESEISKYRTKPV
eukprot:GHVS01025678.1.p1 GENE.GHVS01025678.1~~GHVS01025678.1.p1  ORF type:complete len:491 (+),score=75.58 GHVS01025678.1:157-1629(+)